LGIFLFARVRKDLEDTYPSAFSVGYQEPCPERLVPSCERNLPLTPIRRWGRGYTERHFHAHSYAFMSSY